MRCACSPMGALRNTKAVETLGQWDTWQFYFDSHGLYVHMFAPTAAFKTMVDGQGFIPKNKNTEMKAAVAKTLGLFS